MSDNKEQCRAEFEAWERNNASNLERDESGQYVNPCVQSAWEGYWQGRAAQPVVLTDEHSASISRAMAILNQEGFKAAAQELSAILAAKEQA